VVTPNLAELVDAPASAGDPAMLLLALSGHLPLTASHDAFICGVSRFLERRSLPLLHVGPPLTDLSALGLNARSTGYLDYFTYRETIRRQNAIAIAPLEGRGDPDTQDFVRGKSDVKMVEFGSLGVPALYADVEPYRETELCCGPLADMGDESAIEEGLERVFRTAGEIKHKAEASVREHRLAIRRTAGSWFKAIEAGRLASPVALADLVKHAAGYAALATSAEEQLAILRRRRPTAPPRPDCQHDARRPTRAETERSGPPAHNAAPPLFDAEFYLATYVDVRNSGLDPYRHYLERGIAERRNPNPFFETSWYVRRNPQAGLPGIDPLQHYLAAAGDPSVDPSPRFSTRLYCQRNPRLEGMHPLEHFLRRLRRG
jgi:hypothetical protein